MGGTCGTHESDEKCIMFWVENLKGTGPLEDLGVKGRVILEWMLGS